ncbi:DoxX family protein [Alteribacillus bidgolensis]|uniref:DoxX-like family protein n=1 Tax=Alteribacillus bidgolensis TaxID=930129 RepID=A0A1G8S3Q1_9BACI|nr:DoxX family protein [Alteribacillus bidgolensis]SDJ23837.1 DoxX-like family protein [Alteribacillus bidgolensis]
MKKINITYWVFTGLLSVLMLIGAIPDILSAPEAVALFNHLGYPAYLLPFIGIAKLLGVVAILIPGFWRIKEWAYAGFTFDLTGAMYSTISVDGLTSGLVVFFIGYTLIAGSYVFYHRKHKEVLLNHTTSGVQEHITN